MKYKYFIRGNEVSKEEYLKHPSVAVCCGEEMDELESKTDKKQEHSVISGTAFTAVRAIKCKCNKCGKVKEVTRK